MAKEISPTTGCTAIAIFVALVILGGWKLVELTIHAWKAVF